MKIGVGSSISIYLLIFVSAASSANVTCPFKYLYHFGAAITDIGNSMLLDSSVPAAHPPYGITYPGSPTGRWSDGLIDFDYASADLGLPYIVPYLSLANFSTLHNGVIFSVARSPVLDRNFFESRNITIEPYAVPLDGQINWFRKYIGSPCPENKVCRNRLGDALVLFGDIEGNDIGYALVQGKTIAEVETYVPHVIEAQMDAAREVIRMGAIRVVIPGNAPLGCYPYILTAMPSDKPTDYDRLGCLKHVNDLIISRNEKLQNAMKELAKEYPHVSLYYGDMYEGARKIIQEKNLLGLDNQGLKACCGTGGKYNYDPDRFCGKTGVPHCKHPEDYVFWDGLFFTSDTYSRIEKSLLLPALIALNCTST